MAYRYSFVVNGKKKTKMLSPVKAARNFCLDCMGGSSKEVHNCTSESRCPLYPFRFGNDPGRKKRVLTTEQRQAAAKRLENARQH